MLDLDEQVEKLDKALASYSERLDINDTKSIYSHLVTNILEARRIKGDDAATNAYPPANVMVYLAQQLALPSLLLSEIPVLLLVLANVDGFRREAVRVANGLLEEASSQARKIKRPKALVKIADAENADDMQYTFVFVIAMELCKLVRTVSLLTYEHVVTHGKPQYLYYLWKKGDAATAWKFMRETFPSLFIKNTEERFEEYTWKAPIHKGSTRSEREQLHVKGKELRAVLAEMKEFDKEWYSKEAR